MISTRHERAALVAVAYSIGIITAFIGYTKGTTNAMPELVSEASVASVVAAIPTPLPVEKASPPISYEKGILLANTAAGERVLSFNPEVSKLPVSIDFERQGVHYDEVLYATAANNEHVFFCEKKSTASENCTPFVFDVLTDAIYPISVNGEAVDMLVSVAQEAKFNGPTLTVRDLTSSPAKPWKFTVADF